MSAGAPPEQYKGDALALLLSRNGEFVRGIVTEELAKGIDAAWRVAADEAVGSLRRQAEAVARGEGVWGRGCGGAEGPCLCCLPACGTFHSFLLWHFFASAGSEGGPALAALLAVPPGAPFPLPPPPPPLSNLVARSVVDSLAGAPELADEGDREQVDGILRLSRALMVGCCLGGVGSKSLLRWLDERLLGRTVLCCYFCGAGLAC